MIKLKVLNLLRREHYSETIIYIVIVKTVQTLIIDVAKALIILI